MKYITTIAESKHLLELGIDPRTADMCYCGNGETDNPADETDYKLYTESYADMVGRLESRLAKDKADKEMFGFDDGSIDCLEDMLKRTFPCWSLGALLELMPTVYDKASDKNVNPLQMVDGAMLVKQCGYKDAALDRIEWLVENKKM